MKAAIEATGKRKLVYNIKRRSVLTEVVDLVDVISVNYIHCVLEGIG